MDRVKAHLEDIIAEHVTIFLIACLHSEEVGSLRMLSQFQWSLHVLLTLPLFNHLFVVSFSYQLLTDKNKTFYAFIIQYIISLLLGFWGFGVLGFWGFGV